MYFNGERIHELCHEANTDPVAYHLDYKIDEISVDETSGDVAGRLLFNE